MPYYWSYLIYALFRPGTILCCCMEQNFNLGNELLFFGCDFCSRFFFYAIDGRTVYGVGLFPKKTAQKRRRSSFPKLQQAQSGCLWPTGRFQKKNVWIKRKTQPVEPVSGQNLSFACSWNCTKEKEEKLNFTLVTDFPNPFNFYFPFNQFIDLVRCSHYGVCHLFVTQFWSPSA